MQVKILKVVVDRQSLSDSFIIPLENFAKEIGFSAQGYFQTSFQTEGPNLKDYKSIMSDLKNLTFW